MTLEVLSNPNYCMILYNSNKWAGGKQDMWVLSLREGLGGVVPIGGDEAEMVGQQPQTLEVVLVRELLFAVLHI